MNMTKVVDALERRVARLTARDATYTQTSYKRFTLTEQPSGKVDISMQGHHYEWAGSLAEAKAKVDRFKEMGLGEDEWSPEARKAAEGSDARVTVDALSKRLDVLRLSRCLARVEDSRKAK
jgi:hypothetical protein